MPSSSNAVPTITVCVTCYNQRQYIGQCLESIIGQQIDVPIEILVGDDGSTDGSVEFIEQYARDDHRIIPIVRPRNVGFVENQRDLFQRARGQFVATCEADDFWTDSSKLRRQTDIMASRPNVSLCITAAVQVNEDGSSREGEIRLSRTSRELDLNEVIREIGGRVPTASLLMRRSALAALPQETYDQVVVDYSLQVLLALRGKVWYDAASSCAYRVMSRGSWTEALASSSEEYLKHHEGLRRYREFLKREVGPRWAGHVSRAFEPLILGFYMSSRIAARHKLRNLPEDMPELSRRGRIIATILTRAPFLVTAGAFARRQLWVPLSRRFRGETQ